MDLKLDKSRLNRWARKLRTYLIDHQQVTIKHSHAISAIAAMLDQPNANQLCALLKRETAVTDDRPDDGRQLHEVSWAWSDPPQVFQTYAWLTPAEAKQLQAALTEIAEEFGDLADIAVAPRVLADGKAWHGNLTALVEGELMDAFNVLPEDLADGDDRVACRVLPPLMSEPAADPRTSGAPCTNDPTALETETLIAELRRRGTLLCAFPPETLARKLSRHPGVQAGSVPARQDADALARARDWVRAHGARIEDRMAIGAHTEIDAAMKQANAYRRSPEEGDEIFTSTASGMSSHVQRPCDNQPRLVEGIFRVVTDCGQIGHIVESGPAWLLIDSPWVPPRPGEVVTHPNAEEAHIVVDAVPDLQVYAADGVYTVIDQYGEEHFVEWSDDAWEVVVTTNHLD